MDVRLPNGLVIENVPEGTTKEQLDGKLASNGYDVKSLMQAPKETSAPPQRSAFGLIDDAGRYFANAVTFGWADKLAALGNSTISGGPYEEALKREREQSKAAGENLPLVAKVPLTIAGAAPLLLGGGPAALAARGASALTGGTSAGAALVKAAQAAKAAMPQGVASAAARLVPQSAVARGAAVGAAEGAGLGALEAAAADTDVGTGALLGGGLGGGLGGTFGKLAQGLSKKRYAAVGTSGDLKKEADALYAEARNSGVLVKSSSVNGIVSDMLGASARFMDDPANAPVATSLVKDYLSKRVNKVQSLGDLNNIRDQIGMRVKSASSGADTSALLSMKSALDSAVESLQQSSLIAGKKESAGLLGEARDMWSRMKKTEQIEDLMVKAESSVSQYSVSGRDNAIRTQFRQLAKNKENMARFSPDEARLIKMVANGTIGSNVMRMIGKLAPTGPVSMIPSIMVGGPAGVAMAGAGIAGKMMTNMATQRRAKDALELVMRGPNATPTNLAQIAQRQGLVSQLPALRGMTTSGLLG